MQLIQRNWNTMDTVTKSINSAYLGSFQHNNNKKMKRRKKKNQE